MEFFKIIFLFPANPSLILMDGREEVVLLTKSGKVFIFFVFVLFFTSCIRSFLGQSLLTRERAYQSHGISLN